MYNLYVLPILIYGSEAWTLTAALESKLDAFDQWYLRRILGLTFHDRVTNIEVRKRTRQKPITDTIKGRRLKLFGHTAQASAEQDHRRTVWAAMSKPPNSWKQPLGRPRNTWLRTVKNDLEDHNIGLFTG